MRKLGTDEYKEEKIISDGFRACMTFNMSQPVGFWFFHAYGTNSAGVDFQTAAKIGDKKPSRKMFTAWARYAKILLTQHAE